MTFSAGVWWSLLMGNLRRAFTLSSSGAIGKGDSRGQEITVGYSVAWGDRKILGSVLWGR